MRVALALAAFAAVLAVTAANGYVPSAPCLNPVCKPTCVPICKVSVTKCTNTTTTNRVCNFKCEVPKPPPPPPTPVVTIIPIKPGYAPVPAGRRLQDATPAVVVQSKPVYAPKKVPYVPVVSKPPLTPPPKPAPLPVCTQDCKNVTGYVYECKPQACTKLVNKTRTSQNCTIECATPPAVTPSVPLPPAAAPAGRRLRNAAPAPAPGSSNCFYKCISFVETYQDVECASDDCKDQDCSGPQVCTCGPPPPVPPPKPTPPPPKPTPPPPKPTPPPPKPTPPPYKPIDWTKVSASVSTVLAGVNNLLNQKDDKPATTSSSTATSSSSTTMPTDMATQPQGSSTSMTTPTNMATQPQGSSDTTVAGAMVSQPQGSVAASSSTAAGVATAVPDTTAPQPLAALQGGPGLQRVLDSMATAAGGANGGADIGAGRATAAGARGMAGSAAGSP